MATPDTGKTDLVVSQTSLTEAILQVVEALQETNRISEVLSGRIGEMNCTLAEICDAVISISAHLKRPAL